MRLRHRPGRLPGKAATDPVLTSRERLQAARLYVITADAAPERMLHAAAGALRGGADVLQLRHKTLPRGELLELAHRLRELARDALFIVNDHVDIALLSGADGAHLGPHDLSLPSARRVAGGRLLLGASASTPDAALAAVDEGADYLGVGATFATPIKSDKAVIGPQGVAAVARAVGATVPVFAIGGIEEANVAQLVAVGVRRVCVIRAVSAAPDPEQAARRLRAMLDR